MNIAKIILTISIGISAVICSICLLIFSCKDSSVYAQTAKSSVFQAFGVVQLEGYSYKVIGYNPKTGETKPIASGDAMDK